MSHDRPTTQLFLLRHAHAGDPEAWSGSDDERPLSPTGEAQAERLASFLRGVGVTVDVAITSPKVRARRTAEIVAGGLGVPVRIDERLAGSLSPGTVDDLLRDAGDPRQVVLVGHDPDFSELLATLADAPGLSMKKGAFARIDLRGRAADGRATLRWLIPPDLLDRDRR